MKKLNSTVNVLKFPIIYPLVALFFVQAGCSDSDASTDPDGGDEADESGAESESQQEDNADSDENADDSNDDEEDDESENENSDDDEDEQSDDEQSDEQDDESEEGEEEEEEEEEDDDDDDDDENDDKISDDENDDEDEENDEIDVVDGEDENEDSSETEDNGDDTSNDSTCEYECMASFQCSQSGGVEATGECDTINFVCCNTQDAADDTEVEDTASDDDSETEESTGSEEDTESDSIQDTSVDTDPDTNADDDNLFDVSYEISSQIATVGIVEWSISESIEDARIQFGPADGDYEYSAPVDLNEPDYRTLLLGMKPDTTYKFTIIAEGVGNTYTSEEFEITTGQQRTGLPNVTIDDRGGNPYRGFTIACTMSMGGGGGGGGGGDGSSFAFIFDKDGDMVWWYDLSGGISGCTRARMSYDGKHMWAGNNNVSGTDGQLFRVTMDGAEPQSYSFPDRHHDFAVLENNNILYFERGPDGSSRDPADYIIEFDPESGDKTELYYQWTDFQSQISTSGSHTNAINFIPHLNAISFSMLGFDAIAVVSYTDGQLMTTYGGSTSDFSNMSWNRQHNHHVTEEGIVIFNNNGTGGGSSLLKYDINGNSAELALDYASGTSSNIFGDAKVLPNGNILVTYSNAGTIHEITSEGDLVQVITTSSIGYTVRRSTLYGPPPPFSD